MSSFNYLVIDAEYSHPVILAIIGCGGFVKL